MGSPGESNNRSEVPRLPIAIEQVPESPSGTETPTRSEERAFDYEWRAFLALHVESGLASSTVNLRMTPLRRLAVEAADNTARPDLPRNRFLDHPDFTGKALSNITG
jgi:hypothetical protein